MSFLQDPKIYKSIIEDVIKTAQTAPFRQIDKNIVAKKLVNNLTRELSGAAPKDSITAANDIGLTMDHLYNLPLLLQFLSQNKLKINGEQIAYTEDASKIVADPSNLTKIDNLYVSIPLLTKYINHLQDKARKDDNTLLETSLGTLIDQIKAIDPKAGLSKTREKSTPESPNIIKDGTIVDRFEHMIFDPKNIRAHGGNTYTLFASNLKSAGTLNAWLRNAGQATVVMYDNNQAKSVSYFDENANRCIVPQVLHERAKYLFSVGNPDEKQIASFYMNRIQEITGQMTGPDGKACPLEAVSTISTQPGTADAGTVDYDTVINTAPLRMRDLSFRRIEDFFTKYQNLLGSKSRPGVQNSINIVLEAIKQIQTPGSFLKNPGMESFNLNAGPEEIKSLLLPPEGKKYVAFLDRLQTIIVNVGYILRDTMNVYEERPDSKNVQSKNILVQQIGYGSGSGSIYGNNLNQIQRMRSFARNA